MSDTETLLPCECLYGQYQWSPREGQPEPAKFDFHASDCPAYYRATIEQLVSERTKALREALEWALDLLDLYDKNLVETFGEPIEKVNAPIDLAAKSKARALLKEGAK